MDVRFKRTSLPSSCNGTIASLTPYCPTDQDIKRWGTLCTNITVLVDPDEEWSQQARAWQALWEREETEQLGSRLILTFWEEPEQDDSEVSSVEGGNDFDDDQKTCQFGDCPFDVEEDRSQRRPDMQSGGLRELYLCSACNKGYHQECVVTLNEQSVEKWDLPANTEEWRCGLCVRENWNGISHIADRGIDLLGQPKYVMQWRGHSVEEATILGNEELTATESGVQLFQQLQSRLARRRASGCDTHGKLHHYHRAHGVASRAIIHPASAAVHVLEEQYNGQMDYGEWKLTHPGLRPPNSWKRVSWQTPAETTAAMRSSRPRRQATNYAQIWSGYETFCKSTLCYQWYNASKLSSARPCPGSGMSWEDFDAGVETELSTLPSGELAAWWNSLGTASEFRQLPLADQRLMQKGWTTWLKVVTWVRGQMDALTRSWQLQRTEGPSKCLLADRLRLRFSQEKIHFQSVLYSRNYDRMYEG